MCIRKPRAGRRLPRALAASASALLLLAALAPHSSGDKPADDATKKLPLMIWKTPEAVPIGSAAGEAPKGADCKKNPERAAYKVTFPTPLKAELNVGDAGAMSKRAVAFRIPATVSDDAYNKADKRLRGFTTEVEIEIKKSSDARATVFVDLAGEAQIWEWPYGHDLHDLSGREKKPKTETARVDSWEMAEAKCASYDALITLVVRGRTDKATGSVQIKSLTIYPKVY